MQVQLSSQVLYNLKSTNVMVSFLIRHDSMSHVFIASMEEMQTLHS